MTAELTYLTLTLILALVQIFAAATARTLETGAKWNAGPRDGEAPPVGRMAGRLQRAQANLFETLPLFIGAILIAHVAGVQGSLTLWGAALYFWARVTYVPLYAFGVTGVRSLAFIVSLAGLIMIMVAVLTPQ